MKHWIACARVSAFAMTGLALTGCASLGFGGGGEPSISPRSAVLEAIDQVEPAIQEVTVLLAAGVISDNVADDVAEYGPVIRRIASTYLDGARACLVAGGVLDTDPAAGRDCDPSTLSSIYDAFNAEVVGWMVAASDRGDQKAAGIIAGARLVVSLVPKPLKAGPLSGYRDEPDVPLALLDARRASLKASFEQLLAAAAARAKK